MTDKRIERPEIRIKGVSNSLKNDLKNIAKNLGVGVGSLLKPKLREIADSYPEHLKKPLRD